MLSGPETHFTPKVVSTGAGAMAINVQPLRGCHPNSERVRAVDAMRRRHLETEEVGRSVG